MKKIIILSLWLLSLNQLSFSQNQTVIDSLNKELKKQNTDTITANILYGLSKEYWGINPDTTMKYGKQALALSERIGYKKGIGNAYNSMGASSKDRGNFSESLEFYNKSLKIREEIGDKKDIANSYNNIGQAYKLMGNLPEALKNHFFSLKIKEAIGDKKGMAVSYNNIGIIFMEQDNYPEALKYYFAALNIQVQVDDKNGIAISHNNIGMVYVAEGDTLKALKNYLEALIIFKETGYRIGIATCKNNVGNIYQYQGRFEEALKEYFEALKLEIEMSDNDGAARTYSNIGATYMKMKHYKDARLYLDKSLAISKVTGSLMQLKYTYIYLSTLDSATGNFKESLMYYKLFTIVRDSLLNEEVTQLRMQFAFDKKMDSLNLANIAREAREKENEMMKDDIDNRNYLAILLVILLITLLVYRYKGKRVIKIFGFAFKLNNAIKLFGRFALLLLFKLIELVIHKPIARVTHENTLALFTVLVIVGIILAVIYPPIEKCLIVKPKKKKTLPLAASKLSNA